MGRFNKFLEACDGSGKRKRKRKGKNMMDEGAVFKSKYGNLSVKDDILEGVTIEELQDTVYSNLPKDKINPKSVQKELDNIIKMKLSDAKSIAKKVIPELAKDLSTEGDM